MPPTLEQLYPHFQFRREILRDLGGLCKDHRLPHELFRYIFEYLVIDACKLKAMYFKNSQCDIEAHILWRTWKEEAFPTALGGWRRYYSYFDGWSARQVVCKLIKEKAIYYMTAKNYFAKDPYEVQENDPYDDWEEFGYGKLVKVE